MVEPYSATQIYSFCEQHWPQSHTLTHQHILYLHRLVQLESLETGQVFKTHELSAAEFDILATLRRTQAPHILSPTELQRSTLLSSGGQTKVLYHLESKRFISRSVNPTDKRSKFVHLTSKGKRTVETAMAEMLERLETVFNQSKLNKQEQSQLIKLLSKLLDTLEDNA